MSERSGKQQYQDSRAQSDKRVIGFSKCKGHLPSTSANRTANAQHPNGGVQISITPCLLAWVPAVLVQMIQIREEVRAVQLWQNPQGIHILSKNALIQCLLLRDDWRAKSLGPLSDPCVARLSTASARSPP